MKKIILIFSLFTAFNIFSIPLIAQEKKIQKHSVKEKILYEQWYQIIINKKDKIAYYSDKVVQIDDKIQFKHSIWNEEEGFINREELSAFSNDHLDLTPSFFNLFQKYRNTETTIDGTIQNGTQLNLSIKKTNEKTKNIQKHVRKDSIFSLFFPIWLAKRIDKIKGGQAQSIFVIIEDAKDDSPLQEITTATLVPQDDFAKKTDSYKFIIKFLGQQSTWWIKKNGLVEKIDMPSKNAEVVRVSATDAQKTFLKK